MQELEKILKEIKGLHGEVGSECTIEDRHAKRAWEHCLKRVEDIICKHMNDGWIPVEKELPPNAKQKGAFCPKYQIMTKYGITEGWYNPDYESWFCLFWFMENKFTKGYIDFERGDVPKVVQIEKGIDLVLAWRPLPEPYKP